MEPLEIYVLNVGQADTAIIKTPAGNFILIDAYKGPKVRRVLEALDPGPRISDLIVTHPHRDHHLAVGQVLKNYAVDRVTLAPFWYRAKTEPLLGDDLYMKYINFAHERRIPLRFLGGYQRSYPDGRKYPDYSNEVCLELLGPPHDILEELQESEAINYNHLSIIARLSYGEHFSMVFAGDAQMENWAHYDRENMLKKCTILKAAHHGSMNGTQWERLERLGPNLVIVSAKRKKGDLPDLIGSTTFWKYERNHKGRLVVLTATTGTIKISVADPESGRYETVCYGESAKSSDIPWDEAQDSLPPTTWPQIVQEKWEEAQQEA